MNKDLIQEQEDKAFKRGGEQCTARGRCKELQSYFALYIYTFISMYSDNIVVFQKPSQMLNLKLLHNKT